MRKSTITKLLSTERCLKEGRLTGLLANSLTGLQSDSLTVF